MFDEAVNGSDKKQWLKAVDEEFVRFQKNASLNLQKEVK